MIEDTLGRRIRGAIESFDLPPYPVGSMRPLPKDGSTSSPRTRHRLAFALVAAGALAILGASAALAVPNVFSDRLLRAFDRVGIHLRGAHLVTLDTRVVSLDEARAAAGFEIIVPPNARLVKTMLSMDRARRGVFVVLVLEDERQQVALAESRFDPRHPDVAKPAFRVNADGSVRQLAAPVVWRIGETQLEITPYDARSRAFAERLQRETLASGRSLR